MGKQLEAVIFVMDYLQLQFFDFLVTMTEWPVLQIGSGTFTFGSPGYRDALCSLIGEDVRDVLFDKNRQLKLTFSAGVLEFSMVSERRNGDEALLIHGTSGKKEWEVGHFVKA